MDDEKRKRRAWKSSMVYQTQSADKIFSKNLEQASNDDSFINETENQSMDLKSICNNECSLSRDITYNSINMSEGEGDGDWDEITGRVTVLDEILQEKEAVYEELHAEFDHLGTDVSSPTSSHISQNSNIPNKDIIETYRNKFKEYENAIHHRDILIEDLTKSLTQAIASRDGLVSQLNILNSTQLRISNGENTCEGKVSTIDSTSYSDKDMKHNSVDSNISNSEINQKQYEEQMEKIKKQTQTIIEKFTIKTHTNNIKHKNEITELKQAHDTELENLKKEYEQNEDHYRNKLADLQSELIDCKRNIESLKHEAICSKESYTTEKELFIEQIKLHKLQLQDMATKFLTTTTVLDSKQSIELSLDRAIHDLALSKSEIECHKTDDKQPEERMSVNRNFSARKSSSTFSKASFTEMDATAYQSFDEMAIQYQFTKQALDEKAPLQTNLINKIDNYEKQVEELKKAEDNYKEQIKDLTNTCEQLKNTTKTDEQKIENYLKKLDEIYKINHSLMEENNKLKNGLTSAYTECALIQEKLDQTLGCGETDSTIMLDQTESPDSSTLKLEELLLKQTDYNKMLQKLDLCRKQFDDYKKENLNLKLEIETKTKEQKELLKKIDDKEESYNKEIKLLKIKISDEAYKFEQLILTYENREAILKQSATDMEVKHTQEVEELRKYFEQKCFEMKKQYSEDVFSLQSRKILDNDSKIEDLSDDIYVAGSTVNCLGGGGDALGILEKELKSDHLELTSEEPKNSFNEGIIKEYKEQNIQKQQQDLNGKPKRTTALLKLVNQFCQTEDYCTAGVESSNVLNELRADYNRQLDEQVKLARNDIINDFQQEIEFVINDDSESHENWSSELFTLYNKLTNNAGKNLKNLKERHGQEIKRLKEGNNKIIYDLQEEIKRLKTESHASLQSHLIHDRDTLQRTCVTLKDLVSQLIVYFNDCEEELNSTLINEVLKKQLTRTDNNLSFDVDQYTKTKRVRLAPQSNEISSIIFSDNNLLDLVNKEQDIKKALKSDLDACLQRLKADSADILNVSYSDNESWSTGPSENSNEKLMEVEKLLARYQEENEHFKVKIIDLQQRLLLTENKKEVISEGYGLQDETGGKESLEDFSELQDRAKHVVTNGSNDAGYLIQLIEELYKHADKTSEDMKREKEDLQHQIEAADKQLRSTRKFQEEQAVEREAERDEAAKQIQELQERLREREREKDREYHITSVEQSALSPASTSTGNTTLRQFDESEIDAPVESLSSQLRELEIKKTEAQNELKDAVNKIYELREILRDFDQQLQSRINKEDFLNDQIKQLEGIILSQTMNQEKLVQELDAVKSGNENNQLRDHIRHLQEELRKHQLSSEQLTSNSSALKQLRLYIRDMQSQMDRKTRELELLHVCGSSLSLSQPSEDVSIREQIEAARCPTPDDPCLPLVLPLDHLFKLKETLFKHFRAEDVALKRLKDLDIQYSNIQKQNEELLAENEILQQTTSEQLFQIETLRARLEQQKQNALFAQQRATSRLESQLYELNDKLETTERAVTEKDIELTEIKDQLERMSRILAEKENEIANVVQSENDIIQKLRDKLELVEEEKLIMKAKLSFLEKNQNNLQLIDTILNARKEEIEQLTERNKQLENQLDIYLKLDDEQLREIGKYRNEQINSARTMSDVLSIKSDCDESVAIREAPNITKSQNISNLKLPNITVHSAVPQSKKDVDFSEDMIETPKVPRLNLESLTCVSGSISSNIIEISKEYDGLQMNACDKISLAAISSSTQSDNETIEESLEDPNNFICHRHDKINKSNSDTENELMTSQRIKELEIHLSEMKSELDNKSIILKQRDTELLEIQNNLQQLQENIESLNRDRLYYKAESEIAKMNETKIQRDLEEVENILKKQTDEFDEFKQKTQIMKQMLDEESKRCKQNELILQEKFFEIEKLNEVINAKDFTIQKLQHSNIEIEKEIKDLYECRRKFDANEIQCLNDSLIPSEKDQEIYRLQEYVKVIPLQKRDEDIREMHDDGRNLKYALETIRSKIQESGNLVELRRKLKEEIKKNIELTEEIAKLRTEIEMLGGSRRTEEDMNDITDMVQKELNLSARLDKQILNVIDGEPENMLQSCEELKQAKKEIEELNRFKDDLEIEREMLRSQISEYENRIVQLKTDSQEESKRIARLDEELSKERHVIRSLQTQLQKEKNMSEEDKLKDTELISQLRIKLDEALEVKDRLVMEQKNMELMHAMKDLDKNTFTDLQDQLKKEIMSLVEKLEIEQRKCKELEEKLEKLNNEKEYTEKQHVILEAEIKKLTTNAEFTDSVKEQLKSDLKRAKEELKTKTKDCNLHVSLLQTMSDADNKRNQRRTNEHSELKNVRRELKNAQEVMLDFQVDMKALNKQLSESGERESKLSRRIESLIDKEIELTEELNSIKKENKKLKSTIVDQMSNMKINNLRRELELIEQLKRERSLLPDKYSSSKIVESVKDTTVQKLFQDNLRLKEENERLLEQVRVLESQVSQMRDNNSNSNSKTDLKERMQYFYGKFLRFESRTKSLIFQKRYLLCLLISFERIEENSLATLAQLTDKQREISRGGTHHRYNPRIRFRTVVLFVIAIRRMKWLILRWTTGSRVGANVVLNMESHLLSQPRHRVVETTERSQPTRDRNYNGTGNFTHYTYPRRLNNIQQNLHLNVPERSTSNFKSN